MIDLFAFFWGVLCGQGSFVIAFLLAKITKPLLTQKFGAKSKEDAILCPRCQSAKVAYTQEPGLLWCQACGKEWENGKDNIKKPANTKESPASK